MVLQEDSFDIAEGDGNKRLTETCVTLHTCHLYGEAAHQSNQEQIIEKSAVLLLRDLKYALRIVFIHAKIVFLFFCLSFFLFFLCFF